MDDLMCYGLEMKSDVPHMQSGRTPQKEGGRRMNICHKGKCFNPALRGFRYCLSCLRGKGEEE